MPKVSDEYLAQRRRGIIDAAATAFATHGFEGTTVARLEEATGLSRGAIFNYFEDKDDLFLTVAETLTSELMQRLSDADAPTHTLRLMAEQDPAVVGMFVEVSRRVRTDAAFGRRYRARGAAAGQRLVELVARAVRGGAVRDDLDPDTVAGLLALVLDGLALQIAMSDGPPEDFDQVTDLLDELLRPR